MTSGLAEGALAFLSGGDAGRLGAFVRVLGRGETATGAARVAGVRALVGKVGEAVSVRETMGVVLSDASGDLTAGLKLLAQPIKLRLAREAGETGVSDYSSNVVLIEPLATLKAVHDFLAAKARPPQRIRVIAASESLLLQLFPCNSALPPFSRVVVCALPRRAAFSRRSTSRKACALSRREPGRGRRRAD